MSASRREDIAVADEPALRLSRRCILAATVLPLFASAIWSPVDAAEVIAFDNLYASFGVRGYVLADRVKALAGKPVTMVGFVAPPLKAESRFFVLTREAMALCPFCQSDADWPADIVVIYLRSATALPPGGRKVEVGGVLEVGAKTDGETGFLSHIRIVDAVFRDSAG